MSGFSSSSAGRNAGGMTGVYGVSRSSEIAVDPVDLPQVGKVEHPLDVEDLPLLHPEPLDELAPQLRLHRVTDLEPDHLAESPLA